MDYHALEAMQCMLERRRNGETGVKAVQLIEGPGRLASRQGRPLVAPPAGSGPCAQHLALGQVGSIDGRTQDLAHSGELEELVKDPAAYLIEYRDGLRATLLMLNGAVQDYTLPAGLRRTRRDSSRRSSCCRCCRTWPIRRA